MQIVATKPETTEETLIKLYTDLTGASETAARSVFAYVSSDRGGSPEGTGDSRLNVWTEAERASRTDSATTQPKPG